MAYFSFILTLRRRALAVVHERHSHVTYSAFPSSKSIVSFCSLHVESMFKTWRISDCAPSMSWSMTLAGILIFSLNHTVSHGIDVANIRTNLNAIDNILERMDATSGLEVPSMIHPLTLLAVSSLPEREVVSHIRQWLQLWCASIIRDADYRHLFRGKRSAQ